MVTVKILRSPESEAFFPLQDILMNILSQRERYSIESTKKEKDKIEKTMGWVMCRMEAAQRYGINPEDVKIDIHEKGKPFFPDHAGFGFNISHGGSLIVVACSGREEIGVDVESLDRNANTEIASRHFTEHEATFLQSIPEEERTQMFLRFWTIKEAYLKMTGTGLARPLSEFEVRYTPEDIRIYDNGQLQNCIVKQHDFEEKQVITVCVKGEENNFQFVETDMETIINFVGKNR